ncbi:hypothetical protein CLV30_102134 [Haloactinopolyspora alba]|uniref:Uncharacterized protein n=1 Tax=Haloactinopolyspora alba TaxID=648780 RepID=A0A2P8EBB8_9ACTN|nr:hypothetical protein [Haloactinopolyspora alba]PSL06748.1 hypothetical protein CLV30_102134 [Haloactinopolyspora alba]
MNTVAQLGHVRKLALLVALVWSVGLLVAGFTVPMYRQETESSSGTISHGTDTFVGVNGSQSVIVLLAPLLVSILVAGALLMRRVPGTMAIAWTMTAALCGLTALAMLSIGVLVLPVAAALVVACTAKPSSPAQSGAS